MIEKIKENMMVVDPALKGKAKELAEKKAYASALAFATRNRMVNLFYDHDSDKMLDKKIGVLEKIVNGGNPSDFWGEFVDILEKYPKGDDVDVKW